jgi:hypothetical protein
MTQETEFRIQNAEKRMQDAGCGMKEKNMDHGS